MELKTEVEEKGGLRTSPLILAPEIEHLEELGPSRMLYLWKGKLTARPVFGAEVWGFLAENSMSDFEVQSKASINKIRGLRKSFGIGEAPSRVFHPQTASPYTGRQYIINVQDCYQLVREYYYRELSIELPDHDSEKFWIDGGEGQGTNMIEQLKKDGFRVISDHRQKGDLIVMSYNAPAGYANHLGVWTGTDVLHHQPERLSQRQEYSNFLKARTVCWMRYGS